jgi:hypothetical protein
LLLEELILIPTMVGFAVKNSMNFIGKMQNLGTAADE